MARAAFFPSVDLAGNMSHYRNSYGNSDRKLLGYHAEQYTLAISTSWKLDIWGKLNRLSKARYAQFMNTHAYRNLIQTSLIANIATSYYSLLALDEQLRIMYETVKLLEETTTTMEAMMQAGLLNGASVQQSKALLYNTQINIPELESQIRQMENSVCLMLGRNPGAVQRTRFEEQVISVNPDYGILAQMLSRRPDVQQAE
jgi:outer membrane protein TolC